MNTKATPAEKRYMERQEIVIWWDYDMYQKTVTYRNKNLLRASKDRSCIKCGASDGTVVRCHYSGIMAHRLGKGVAIKCHDFASADLCASCHAEFDGYEDGNDYERAAEFLILCMMTLARDFKDGVIK